MNLDCCEGGSRLECELDAEVGLDRSCTYIDVRVGQHFENSLCLGHSVGGRVRGKVRLEKA